MQLSVLFIFLCLLQIITKFVVEIFFVCGDCGYAGGSDCSSYGNQPELKGLWVR